MTDEEYVRSKWEKVDSRETYVAGHGYCVSLPVLWHEAMTTGYFKTEAEAWSASRTFTEQREREIAEVDEEIAFLDDEKRVWPKHYNCDAPKRTLSRLQSIRAELTKGMKQQGKAE